MKKAFTLAEVLITIGVIGVVAAIMLPAIINKIEQRQHIAMWKKKYSEIANIYTLVKEEISAPICVERKDDKFATPAKCSTLKTPAGSAYTTLSPEFVKRFVSHLKVVDSCAPIDAYGSNSSTCNNYYKKWIGICNRHDSLYESLPNKSPGKQKIPTACKGTVTNDKSSFIPWDYNNYAVLLADGAVIYFGGHATGWITVDVNGFGKGPNIIGKDVFTAMVNDEWIKPLGAAGTFSTSVNGTECRCASDYGNSSFSQGFLGSGDLLHGVMISGGCCSAVYLYQK